MKERGSEGGREEEKEGGREGGRGGEREGERERRREGESREREWYGQSSCESTPVVRHTYVPSSSQQVKICWFPIELCK